MRYGGMSGQFELIGLPTCHLGAMKKLLRNSFLLLLVLFLLRGWLFRLMVAYHPISERPSIVVEDKILLQQLKNQPVDSNLQRIVKRSLDLTAAQLRFSFGKCDTDPNRLFYSKNANCVGYASYFNAICSALLNHAGLGERYRVSHLRGRITLFGCYLHQLTDSPFFQDHDYNLVEDLKTGDRVFVDASTRDLLGIGFVRSD
jgi:hypothetical protein